MHTFIWVCLENVLCRQLCFSLLLTIFYTQTWPTSLWMTTTAPAGPLTRTRWPPCLSLGPPRGPWCTPSPISLTLRMPSPASRLPITSSPATATPLAALAANTAKVSCDVWSRQKKKTYWLIHPYRICMFIYGCSLWKSVLKGKSESCCRTESTFILKWIIYSKYRRHLSFKGSTRSK